jgi:anaerobic magnesium-protoporphyrin IX monomethyl ester cyclase
MIDCLVIGHFEPDFAGYVEMVKSMGSGAFRDLNLAYVEIDGKPRHCMDVLNHFSARSRGGQTKPLHNSDFLWPVITYLCTYLGRRGHSFDYVNLPHLEMERLREKLERNDIRVVAVTTTLHVSVVPVLELVNFIRQHNSTAVVMVGGPLISNLSKLESRGALEGVFQYVGADVYVIGSEGERALVNTIEALKVGAPLDGVENIAYRRGGGYVFTACGVESNPLEENMVDYGLFPREEIGEFVTLRTAKSCPFSCAFCGFPQRAGKYKYLSVKLVERELDAVSRVGTVTTLTFIDDTFNVPKNRFKELLRMMIRNGYGFKWNAFFRCDYADEEMIGLMGEAGCEGVFIGVESGSDAQLQRMNKTARRKDYLRAIPLLRAAGVRTHASLVIGFPGETLETFRETVSLIAEARPDTFRAQLWYADPITPAWERREAYGLKGATFNWSHRTMDSATACDLVEEMFLNVSGSVWLPQNGFEMWSLFYLQRKGMTFEQVMALLRCFNEAVRAKLREPHRREPDPPLRLRLSEVCQFGPERTYAGPPPGGEGARGAA